MKIIIREAFNRNGFSFWLYQEDGNVCRVVAPVLLTFGKDLPANYAWELPEPTGFIRRSEFNELKNSVIEEMTRSGFLDPGAADTAKELKATKYHLEDMRMLALPERKP